MPHHRLRIVTFAMPGRTALDVFRFPMAGPQLPAAAYERLCTLAPQAMRAAMRKQGALTIQCDSSAVLKAVVMDSDAVSMMSSFMLEVELAGGRLVVLPDLDLGIRARFGAAWIAGRTVSIAASAFLELLQVHDRAMHALDEIHVSARQGRNPPPRLGGVDPVSKKTRRPRTMP